MLVVVVGAQRGGGANDEKRMEQRRRRTNGTMIQGIMQQRRESWCIVKMWCEDSKIKKARGEEDEDEDEAPGKGEELYASAGASIYGELHYSDTQRLC